MTNRTGNDLCSEWSEVIDHVVDAELQRKRLSFADRLRLAQTIVRAPIGGSTVAQELQQVIAIEHLGLCNGFDFRRQRKAGSPPSLYTTGRAALLGVAQRPIDCEKVATDVCVALHVGDRVTAADGLVALAFISRRNRPPPIIARFTEQAVAYLEALSICFPITELSRMLSWISVLSQKG